jgi:uncharacterized membrane protein YhaH (DUF805 family)
MATVKFFVIAGLFFYLITCVALLDIARKDFESFGKKVQWIIIAMIPFVGFIIYFVFGFRKGKKAEEFAP